MHGAGNSSSCLASWALTLLAGTASFRMRLRFVVCSPYFSFPPLHVTTYGSRLLLQTALVDLGVAFLWLKFSRDLMVTRFRAVVLVMGRWCSAAVVAAIIVVLQGRIVHSISKSHTSVSNKGGGRRLPDDLCWGSFATATCSDCYKTRGNHASGTETRA